MANAGRVRTLMEREVETPRGGAVWTHTTVTRITEPLGA